MAGVLADSIYSGMNTRANMRFNTRSSTFGKVRSHAFSKSNSNVMLLWKQQHSAVFRQGFLENDPVFEKDLSPGKGIRHDFAVIRIVASASSAP